MGKMQRTKGQVGERECARVLMAMTGLKVERALGAERDGGCDLVGLPTQYAPEVKRHKVRAYPSWQRQAEENAAGLVPVIFYRLDKTVLWSARCRLSDVLDGMGLPRDQVNDGVWLTMSLADWVEVVGLKRKDTEKG